MPSQPVPEVTNEDVRRVALREFGEAQLFQALSIIDEFGKQKWNQPSARVKLAILKLANGDLNRLRTETKSAIADYRDVLAEAEYPRFAREIGFARASEETKQTVMDADWRQYREWLDKK